MSRVLFALAVGLLLASAGALAMNQDAPVNRIEVAAPTDGLQEYQEIPPATDGPAPVPLPPPPADPPEIVPEAFLGPHGTIEFGSFGSALVAPRGGSITGSHERAIREIKRLIRDLG